VLYVLGEEALLELRKCDRHAFVALALTPSPEGYTLYLAIYVEASESSHDALHWP